MIGASMAVRPPRSRGPVLMMIDALRRIGGSLWMVENAFSGAFVDNAGTTPVTAYGDLLGLTTDRLGVLGSELASQDNATLRNNSAPTFDTLTGATFANATDKVSVGYDNTLLSVVSGKSYQIKVAFSVASGSVACSLRAGGALGTARASSGNYTAGAGVWSFVYAATATENLTLRVSSNTGSGATSVTLSSRSVCELTGNHATQSAVASKPSVQRVPKRTRGATNLLLWSGDFSNAAWTTSKSAGATVGALSTGPDGLQSARIVTFASASDYLYQGLTEYPAVTGASVTSSTIVNSATRAIFYGGSTPAGTDVFAVYDMGSGWWLQTLTRTFTTTTSALTVQVLPGLVAGTFAYHRAALFTGTVTAAQIVDGGGIPLTTTTALPNVTEWANVISFDGSNDFLQTGITTGNEGFVAVGVRHNTAVTCYPLAAGGLIDSMAGMNLRLINGVTPQLLVCDGTLRQVLQADANVTLGTPFVYSGGWNSTDLLVGVDATEKVAARTRNPTAAVTTTIGAADGTGAGVVNGPLYAACRAPVCPDAATRKVIINGIAALQGRTL